MTSAGGTLTSGRCQDPRAGLEAISQSRGPGAAIGRAGGSCPRPPAGSGPYWPLDTASHSEVRLSSPGPAPPAGSSGRQCDSDLSDKTEETAWHPSHVEGISRKSQLAFLHLSALQAALSIGHRGRCRERPGDCERAIDMDVGPPVPFGSSMSGHLQQR